MDDDNTTPETSPAAPAAPGAPGAPAVGSADAARIDAATAPAPRRRRTRGLLIAGGAVLTAALLAGGGVAVGAAIADEADDDATSVTGDSADDDSTDDDSTDGDDDSTDVGATGDVSNLGTDSADDLVSMIDAASAAGEGEPVAIELERDGSAEVTLVGDDGAETEVRVDADGAASVISTEPADSGDTAPQNVLDADAIAEIVDAALAEADGRIVEVEADDDGTSPWDVKVLSSAGQFVEIDLDGGFEVVATGTDTD